MDMVERVALAIEDAQIGYSISLIRLIDLESTYECRVDGIAGVMEFESHADALEFVTARRREVQARAAIQAMRDNVTYEVADRVHRLLDAPSLCVADVQEAIELVFDAALNEPVESR